MTDRRPSSGRRTPPLAFVLALGLAGADAPPAPSPPQEGDPPVVFTANFDGEGLTGWDFTDPKAWRLATVDGNRVLDQYQASKYEPKVRSPFNIALAPGVDVGDFVLDLKVRSTGRDYGHRDLCFIFGHQDPAHFYYVHLGKQADPHANSIFLVDGEPRVSIAEARTEGTPWTDGWHRVRLVRKVDDGLIQVYFDDLTKPAMTAHDRTFKHGRIGVGSFDDTGQFDEITVRGKRTDEKAGRSGTR